MMTEMYGEQLAAPSIETARTQEVEASMAAIDQAFERQYQEVCVEYWTEAARQHDPAAIGRLKGFGSSAVLESLANEGIEGAADALQQLGQVATFQQNIAALPHTRFDSKSDYTEVV